MDVFGSRIFWRSLRLIQLFVTILVFGLSAYAIESWNSYQTPTIPIKLNFLLLSSLVTPLALTYLLVVPVHTLNPRWSSTNSVACIEGSVALLWAASSISTAVHVTERTCFGGVCSLAQVATVLGVFEWLAFMASFGFSLATTIRDAMGGCPVVEEFSVVKTGKAVQTGKGGVGF